jgi:hypothetical protein
LPPFRASSRRCPVTPDTVLYREAIHVASIKSRVCMHLARCMKHDATMIVIVHTKDRTVPVCTVL